MLQVAKLDPVRKQVFGFANVALDRDGSVVTDLQNDQIPPDVLEQAAYDFNLRFRGAGEMHVGEMVKGQLIESLVFTPDKLAALGIEKGALAGSWWVGFQLDAATFAKVQAGDYRMFSIQGSAVYEEIEVDE